MEVKDKKKNWFMVLGGCLAVIVIIFIILLIPNLQFTNNTNVYSDEISLANSTGASAQTVCVAAKSEKKEISITTYTNSCSPEAKSCVKVASAGGPCGNSSACYSQTIVKYQTKYSCSNGYTQYGGQCCKNVQISQNKKTRTCYRQGNSITSCSSITIDSSNGETCASAGYYSSPQECSGHMKKITCYLPDSNCAGVTFATSTCASGYESESTCKKMLNNSVKCYKITDLGDRKICSEATFAGSSCPQGYSSSNSVCKGIDSKNDGPCKIESVDTESRITSIHRDGRNENSYYVGTIITSGNCEGVKIPCDTDNGKASIKEGKLTGNETSHVDILGEKGKNEYKCYIYPDNACDNSTVTSKLGDTSKDGYSTASSQGSDTVPTIKYDWDSTTTCYHWTPVHTSALSADAAGDNEYWSDYGICADGTFGYTKHWTRGVYCGGTPVIVPPVENAACYANNEDIKEATKAEWRTSSTSELKYKITKGFYGEIITSQNHFEQCAIHYCYADNKDIKKATKTSWAVAPNATLKYKITLGLDGVTPITAKNYTEQCRASNEEYACYADARTIANAKNVKWQTGPTEELKYKITVGYDGVTKISEANYDTECVIKYDVPKYCYANAPTLDEATQTDLLTGPTDNLIYLVKDKNGNSITNKNDCIASACYVNKNNNKYEWARVGSLDESLYTKVDIALKKDCHDTSACMAEKTKDGYKNYKWVSTKSGENGIDDLIKKGFVVVDDIKDASGCVEGACYTSKDTGAIWIATGEKVPDTYTKVDDSKCFSSLDEDEEEQKENCYVRYFSNGTVDYKWGNNNDSNYQLIDSVNRENCVTRKECYMNLNDYQYYKGDYSLNKNYKLVAKDNCIVDSSVVDTIDTEPNKKIDLVKVELLLIMALLILSIIYIITGKRKYY